MTKPVIKEKQKRNVSKLNRVMILTGIEDIIEVERLLAKLDRQRKIEKKKKIKHKVRCRKPHKKVMRGQPLPPMQPQTIKSDPLTIMVLINLLMEKGILTPDEVKNLKVEDNSPLKHLNFEFTDQVLDRGQCRTYWLYLMKYNELFCALCGHPITEARKGPWRLTAEHRMPRSKGGATDSTNLDPSHEICNNIKADMLPEEWEKVGLEALRSYGIHVDVNRTRYKYLKEIQR